TTPLPRPDITPPVTKMNFARTFTDGRWDFYSLLVRRATTSLVVTSQIETKILIRRDFLQRNVF
ncbi:MAG: hypothetical protein QXE82_03605, partial [Candidatus Nitrosotenuis sp.]